MLASLSLVSAFLALEAHGEPFPDFVLVTARRALFALAAGSPTEPPPPPPSPPLLTTALSAPSSLNTVLRARDK